MRFPLDKPESLLIYISALNPKMLQLAGMKADGVILSHMPIEAADDVKALVEKGASVAGMVPLLTSRSASTCLQESIILKG